MPPRRRPGGRTWGPFQGNGGRSGETAAHALRPTRSRWRRRPREAVLSDGGAASRRSRLGQATLMGPHSAPGPPRCARPGATPGPCSLPATHGAYRAGASARQSRQRAGAIGGHLVERPVSVSPGRLAVSSSPTPSFHHAVSRKPAHPLVLLGPPAVQPTHRSPRLRVGGQRCFSRQPHQRYASDKQCPGSGYSAAAAVCQTAH